jgi:hypothetical protein
VYIAPPVGNVNCNEVSPPTAHSSYLLIELGKDRYGTKISNPEIPMTKY